MTYDTLVEDIKYITTKGNEPSFLDKIPRIVTYAQYDLQRKLKILGAQNTVNGIIYPGVNVIQKPSYLVYTLTFSYNDPEHSNQKRILKKRTLEYVQRYQVSDEFVGYPKYYADLDEYNTFQIAPTPKALASPYTGFPFTLIYHSIIDPLNTTTQQNWLTMRVPDLLLNACLKHAFSELRNMDMSSYYDNLMEKGIAAIQTLDIIGKSDRSIQSKID